jgi:hypothetical protein
MEYMNAAAQIVPMLVDRKVLDASQPGHRRETIERALALALEIVEKVAREKLASA